ncbi:hypothetical protein PFISCL1PPCAC_9927, partial [Pristionchus fissidentatus]
ARPSSTLTMSGDFGNASPNPLALNNPSTSAPMERAPIKTKISLRATTPPTPFYTMKANLPPQSQLLGSMDLLNVYDLSKAYNNFCCPSGRKQVAHETLNSFMPHVTGQFDWEKGQEISWLKMLIDKPPITGKEIVPLNASAMAAFKLTPGAPIDDQYKFIFDKSYESMIKKDKGMVDKKDGSKWERPEDYSKRPNNSIDEDGIDHWAMDNPPPDFGTDDEGGPKKKKRKTDKDREERKERKKEKKEKKE